MDTASEDLCQLFSRQTTTVGSLFQFERKEWNTRTSVRSRDFQCCYRGIVPAKKEVSHNSSLLIDLDFLMKNWLHLLNRMRELSKCQQQQLQLIRLIVQKMEIHTEDFAEYSENEWDRELTDLDKTLPDLPISLPSSVSKSWGKSHRCCRSLSNFSGWWFQGTLRFKWKSMWIW